MRNKFRKYFGVAALTASALAFSAQAEVALWTANSGLLPTDLSPNWILANTTINRGPVLGDDYLTINTRRSAQAMYFNFGPNGMEIPEHLTIEFRARFVSSTNPNADFSSMMVYFALGNGLGNVLSISRDALWLQGGDCDVNPAAIVDTDNSFHTYRIELGGITAGTPINVYYDNGANPLFTGSLLLDHQLNGEGQRLGFGDGTPEASGESQWEYLWHNAACVPINSIPEPTSAALLIGGAALMLINRVRRK